MPQSYNPFRQRDTTQLAGWLFADLLLGLMMIFLVSVPRILHLPPLPPEMTVSAKSLSPADPDCSGGITNPQCTVTVQETGSSQGPLNWTTSSDMSNDVKFTPPSGTLSPKQSVTVHISNIPCQRGSFTFKGQQGVIPATVSWTCTPRPVRLESNYKQFTVTIQDINGLLNHSTQSINDIEQQIRNQPILQGRSVGLAVVYGGAPTTNDISQAHQIATNVYGILGMLGQKGFAFDRASYFDPLFLLEGDANTVTIDVYLYVQA